MRLRQNLLVWLLKYIVSIYSNDAFEANRTYGFLSKTHCIANVHITRTHCVANVHITKTHSIENVHITKRHVLCDKKYFADQFIINF